LSEEITRVVLRWESLRIRIESNHYPETELSTNLLVICCGFGIFLLSNFPPTQRFGVFVIFGSATAQVYAADSRQTSSDRNSSMEISAAIPATALRVQYVTYLASEAKVLFSIFGATLTFVADSHCPRVLLQCLRMSLISVSSRVVVIPQLRGALG
jgi:hypothetical protein